MAKSVLIESRLNSLKLCESTEKPRKGCLGRIEGICADFVNPTRNGRHYSRELWENVFNNELIKEALESKTLIGELDHPEDRFEPLAQEACVVLTDYHFNDEDQTLTAGFDILDTQKGRILKSLLDYGCIMGVSSRGQGDTIQHGDYEEVDPSTYDFACFDVVLTPAVKSARQTVVESKRMNTKLISLEESISKEIDNAKSVNELKDIKSVVISSNIANTPKILSAIDKKCDSLNMGEKTILEQTRKELHDARITINRLQKEVDDYSAGTIKEVKELRQAAADLTRQNLAYQHRESRLSEGITAVREDNRKLHLDIERLNAKVDRRDAKIQKVKEKVITAKEQISKVKAESECLREEYAEKLRNAKSRNGKLHNRNQVLTKEVAEYIQNIGSLNDQIADLTETINSLKTDNETLQLQLKESKENLINKSSQITESINREKSRNSEKLTEAVKKLSEMQNSYIKVAAIQNGLKESQIRPLITESMTSSDIDKVIAEERNKMDRYNELPFHTTKPKPTTIVESSAILSSETDDEFSNSKKFMEKVAGIDE